MNADRREKRSFNQSTTTGHAFSHSFKIKCDFSWEKKNKTQANDHIKPQRCNFKKESLVNELILILK